MPNLIRSGYRLEYKRTGSSEPCDITLGIFSNIRDAHKHARETVTKNGYLIYYIIGVGVRRAGFRQAWTNCQKQPVMRHDRFQTKKWKLLWSAIPGS